MIGKTTAEYSMFHLKLLLLIVLTLLASGCKQPTETEFEPPSYYHPYSVIKTAENTYIIAGEHYYYGIRKGFLLEFDDAGNLLWTKEYPPPENHYTRSFFRVKHLRDGNFVAVGYGEGDFTGYQGVFGMLVALIDRNGNKIWENLYFIGSNVGHFAHDVEETANGELIVVGRVGTVGFTPFPWSDALILKLNREGNKLSEKQFRDYDSFDAIVKSSDGNFIIGGSAIAKVDSNLNVIWHLPLEGENVKIMTGGNVQIKRTGNTEYVVSVVKYLPSYVITIYRIDESGNILSSFDYQCDTGVVRSARLEVDGDNYIIAYVCMDNPYNETRHQLFILKADKNGNIVWKKLIRERRVEDGGIYSYPFIKAADGNYILILEEPIPGKSRNELVAIKFDREGNILWQKRLLP